jgi:hypothetical protein
MQLRGTLLLRAAQAITLAIAITGGSASAMTIVVTFDSTISANFGSNTAAFEAAFNSAAALYMAEFVNPIHVNINVTSVTGTGTLGMSSTSVGSVGWTTLRNSLVNDTNAGDTVKQTATGAGGSITAADPSGGADTWYVSRAQAKALGLLPDDLATDGTITIGSGFNYAYTPGSVGPGQYDLQGVADHEISEVMGRIGFSGSNFNGGPAVSLLDAYSYRSAGARGLTDQGAGNFFSIDGGGTLLQQFNNATSLGGDTRDWCSPAACSVNDSFNAFSSSGVANPVSAVDIQLLDALGYDPSSTSGVPEPSTVFLLISGFAAGVFLHRSATKK